jgi:hypothetical protein
VRPSHSANRPAWLGHSAGHGVASCCPQGHGRPIVALSQCGQSAAWSTRWRMRVRARWPLGAIDDCSLPNNGGQYLHGTVHQAKAYTLGNLSGGDSHQWRKMVKGGGAPCEWWRRDDSGRRRGSNERRLNPARPGEDEYCAATPERERKALGRRAGTTRRTVALVLDRRGCGAGELLRGWAVLLGLPSRRNKWR